MVRPVFKKNINGEVIIDTLDLSPQCIDKGKAGASLVAQLLVTKCVDHNPHYPFLEYRAEIYCERKHLALSEN